MMTHFDPLEATCCLILGGWFRVNLSDEDIADFEVLRNVAMATIFGFLYTAAHWRDLANPTEPSVCQLLEMGKF